MTHADHGRRRRTSRISPRSASSPTSWPTSGGATSITLRSWAHAWMNESFGTYSDYLYHRHDRGDDEGRGQSPGQADRLPPGGEDPLHPPDRVRPLRQAGATCSTRTPIPRAPSSCTCSGRSSATRSFFKTLQPLPPPLRLRRRSTPADFIRSVKTVTGQNLDWFFDQWLFKPGHPVFDVRSEWDPAQQGRPPQGRAGPGLRQGRARLPRPGLRQDRHGRRRGRRSRVWIREREETFEFPAETKPLLVRFDAGERADQGDGFPEGDGRASLPARERRRHRPDGRRRGARRRPGPTRRPGGDFPQRPERSLLGGPPGRPRGSGPSPAVRGRGRAQDRPAVTPIPRFGPRRSRLLALSRTSASGLFIRTSSGRTGAPASGPRPSAPWV
ncbi:MAG: hypothetical protein MZV63_13660 [Marinilabiliales bacterium]|nr:hypothetical protein [Marinilabiliales bacterium]